MKTTFNSKNLLFRLPVLLLAIIMLTFSACKKSSTTSADDSISGSDKADVTSALNSSADDASSTAGNVSKVAGKTAALSLCGVTSIDTSNQSNGVITITYGGDVCGSKILSRTGTLVITLQGYATGTRWQTPGAVLQLAFTNLKFTNSATGGSVTFNGTYNIENVSGGLAWKIMADDSSGTCVHTETATGLAITFEDGTQRTWNINRTRTYSGTIGGPKTVTVSGNATESGVNNVDMWGTNRNDVAFINSIATPISVSTTCGLFTPYAGQETQQLDNKASRTVTVQYGVDSDGNQATSCGGYYKITYTLNGLSKTKINSYWF